jgi:hypothetical protein
MDDDRESAWIKRWQEPDGSWHIVLTPRMLTAVSRKTFQSFKRALYDMETDLASAKTERTNER